VRVDIDGLCVALFRLNDKFYAIEDACLHMGGPLSEGSVNQGIVMCPWHKWQYDLGTGERVDRRGSPARTYPVEVRDGWILLGL
jgi:nitrite reductase/ring-hydroxylating ferredoxin subunit